MAFQPVLPGQIFRPEATASSIFADYVDFRFQDNAPFLPDFHYYHINQGQDIRCPGLAQIHYEIAMLFRYFRLSDRAAL